mmetsp:Transcript_9882/g.17308  ORF Transcript_9882/g.17308 Transcript_9882/m.17308 type:complete len:260 (-) Transcript_9882:16-795(-)
MTANLQDNVHTLAAKDVQLDQSSKEIETLQIRLKKTEEKLLSRAKELENELTKQKSTEESVRSNYTNALHDLDESNARVEKLKCDLSNTIQASKQRERNSIEQIRAETKHDTAVLEAKLAAVIAYQEKAENRERQASILAQEAREDRNEIVAKMNDNVESARKHMSAMHITEIKQMNAQLDCAKHENANLLEQIQRLTQQLLESTKNMNDAEMRVKEMNFKLEEKAEQCNMLQREIEQVMTHSMFANSYIETIRIQIIR